MTSPMLEVRGLTRRFGTVAAVENIGFAVPAGEIFGFIGPNGAGKTTTMRILTGFMPPDAGRAEVMGLDVQAHGLEQEGGVGVGRILDLGDGRAPGVPAEHADLWGPR